jgi:hypothetical protein
MKKPAGEDQIIAVGFIALLIALASFALVWFDVWPSAKLTVRVSVVTGAGAVAVGLLRRLIVRKDE